MNIPPAPWPWLRSPHEESRRAARRHALSDVVGRSFIFGGGEQRPDGPGSLYPRRLGCRCTVVQISEDRCRCPLIVAFPDGFRGIAERDWLKPVDGAVAA